MDEKARKILFETYWSNKGWKENPSTSPKDFLYAKEKGVMFDRITIDHNECIEKIIKTVSSIQIEDIAKAFLSSLSTRRLDWRSGIASYHIAKMIPKHTYTPIVAGYHYIDGKPKITSYTCEVCKNLKYGIKGKEKYQEEDLNVLNFERMKWGGVRHGDLLYTLFDLTEFKKVNPPEPTETDIEIFRNILDKINSCHPGDYPSKLRDKLADIPNLKSNKEERSVMIEILACIGILNPKSWNRTEPGKHDWTYAVFWRGADGYDENIVKKYFGKYLK